MGRVNRLLSFLLGACLAVPAQGAAPTLSAGVPVSDGESPLWVSQHAVPEVADWNQDGKKDLLVGEFNDGQIQLFLNKGSNASPVFNGFEALAAGGSAIQVPYG
jgi:hypothetical protein